MPRDILDLFYSKVSNNKSNLAVVQKDTQITYGKLISLVQKYAFVFKKIKKNPKILIYLPKSSEAYAAMLASLQVGGIYCPINDTMPIIRLKLIIKKFKPDVIISNKELQSKLQSKIAKINIEDVYNEKLIEILPAHDLAYVIYTSGSTGIPKGVMIKRKALSHYINWALKSMKITSEDRWSQHPNIGFDLSVLDIYGALCGGATLYPIKDPRDQLLLADFIKKNNLTIWNSVPSAIDLMNKNNKMTMSNLRSVRLFTFCGEPLMKNHLKNIFKSCPKALVHNTYGPTEATVSFTLLKLTKNNYNSKCDGQSVALGDPISNMKYYLLNGNNLNEGEIGISGPQLADGYWKNKKKTSSNFVDIDINGKQTQIYLTGDKGYMKKGLLYFGGRIDNQIKIKGYRVEIDEIDVALRKVGVSICKTVFYEQKLITFIEDHKDYNLPKIRESLEQILPHYFIPSQFHRIKKIPRNINGKIDNKKLIKKLIGNRVL